MDNMPCSPTASDLYCPCCDIPCFQYHWGNPRIYHRIFWVHVHHSVVHSEDGDDETEERPGVVENEGGV